MDLQFFGLKEEPFHVTPDPEFLYLSPTHKEALSLLIRGVDQRMGLVLLTGESGVGKTIIVRAFLEHCRQQQNKVIYILNSRVTFGVLMNMLFTVLGLERHSDDAAELLDTFYQFLLEEQRLKRNVVLVVEEAQNMSINTLEALGKLLNLETSQGKLLQVYLVGHSLLEAKLNQQELKQIQQHIQLRGNITVLSSDESLSYIRHRLAKAGMQDKETTLFTPAALKLIVKRSLGIPRKINIICDNALISGSEHGKKPVSEKVVKGVIAAIEGEPVRGPVKWVTICASLVLLSLVIAGFIMIRSVDFSALKKSWQSPGLTAKGQSGDVRPDGAASSVSTPVSNDVKTVPHTTRVATPAPELNTAAAVPPADKQPKSLGGVGLERDEAVSAVIIQPVDQGSVKGPSSGKVHDAAPVAVPEPQSEVRETPKDKAPKNFEEAVDKVVLSLKEPKALSPAPRKPGAITNPEPVDPADQKVDKKMQSAEASGPADSKSSKPGTPKEEEPPDFDKLMDWFINNRSR
jgi:general secretion pathway protein A